MHDISTAFTVFDYFVGALLLIGLLFGLARGFFRELYVLIIWFLAFALGTIFTEPFSDIAANYIKDETFAYLMTFVVIFFIVWLVGSFINLIAGLFMNSMSKSFISRLFGGVLGLVQGVIMTIFVMFLVGNIPGEKLDWFDNSVTVQNSKPLLNWLHDNILSTSEVMKKIVPVKK